MSPGDVDGELTPLGRVGWFLLGGLAMAILGAIIEAVHRACG